jgi:hypothetical protein
MATTTTQARLVILEISRVIDKRDAILALEFIDLDEKSVFLSIIQHLFGKDDRNHSFSLAERDGRRCDVLLSISNPLKLD